MVTFALRDHVSLAADLTRSHITDLILAPGGTGTQLRLLATTRHDGQISSWTINGPGLARLDADNYAGQAALGGDPGIATLATASGTALLTGGAAGNGLSLRTLAADGQMGPDTPLPGTGGVIGGLQATITVALANGNQAIYGGLAGQDGLGHLTFRGNGDFLNARTISDSPGRYAAEVRAMAHAQVDGTDFVFSAAGREHGVSVWQVAANGLLSHRAAVGNAEGLWIATPTALETAALAGQHYLIVAAAQTHSLSVLRIGPDGALNVTEHMLDTRDTRFGGVMDIAVVTLGPMIYVISGGADDGITLHQLLPGGTLVARGTIADSPAMGLADISAIAARANPTGGIDIFVASASETGITRLHADVGPTGQMLYTPATGGTLTGSAGGDLLTGRAGDDRLNGDAGDDILRDGAGADTLTGGAGADIFILDFDNATDVITDFEQGVDRLDLSAWPMVRSIDQLTMTALSNGILITYGNDQLVVLSADGAPILPESLATTDILGGLRIPQDLPSGFPAPERAPPPLPVYAMNEYIRGTGGADTLYGKAGDDLIEGRGGPDMLYGGADNDRLLGETGADRLFGEAGADTLTGDAGTDRLDGGADNDRLYGGTGTDLLEGAEGNDRLYGNRDSDTLLGGDGRDSLWGDHGPDLMDGGAGPDLLKGGMGYDRLRGGSGNDSIYGKTGNDRIHGQDGNDRLYGDDQNDRMDGGAGRDWLDGGTGHDSMRGGTGGDRFYGRSGADRIDGDDGADKAWGQAGFDTLYGGGGADLLDGGTGDDKLIGGSGADRLYGKDGRDVLSGWAGDDFLNGGTGNDLMSGGAGRDTFVFNGGRDRITDFTPGTDRLFLNDTLWNGNPGPRKLMAIHASSDGTDLVLDFDGGAVLRLDDITGAAVILGDIVLI